MDRFKKWDMKHNPSNEYRFFCFDQGDHSYFKTIEEANEYGKDCIDYYLDDYWDEEVTQVMTGEVTFTTQQTQRQERPDDLDEEGVSGDGTYWGDTDCEYRCNYELIEL